MMFAPGSHSFPLCGLVLILAVLLQSVFVAVTYIYFTNELKQLRETYMKSNIACLSGADLGDIFHSADSWDGDGRSDPCWEVKSQLQILIKKILLKNYKSEISAAVKGKVSEILPLAISQNQEHPGHAIAAHVTGNNQKASSPPQNTLMKKFTGHKIHGWKSLKPSFLHNLRIEHGELVIPKSGFYYVYSQTYFRQDSNRHPEEGKGKQLVQQIYKVANYPDPILLMKNAKTTCWSKDAEYGLQSIYQGGVFKLNENDRIFVTVSDISMIDMDENATFFGAFLVV
ncbi:tumor necrosis factor ligand superfamily member 10 isoform X1 [Ascaphus truei]|uniref:tumor necrosis factor ligand superfamily member 10 isoform X1 n=1 Tax=Ascaphus truei TaxID=8439 RepID=UPI003F59F696